MIGIRAVLGAALIVSLTIAASAGALVLALGGSLFVAAIPTLLVIAVTLLLDVFADLPGLLNARTQEPNRDQGIAHPTTGTTNQE